MKDSIKENNPLIHLAEITISYSGKKCSQSLWKK